jgi:DNA invertase Pin-like site-specific DNA recombinase
MKLIGYCRVSTDRQKEEGTIEIQEKALTEWCVKNGHELLQIFKDEGISGSDDIDKRLGLTHLYHYIKTNTVDGILIYKLDRLARDIILSETLVRDFQRLGLQLISINEPGITGNDIDPNRKLLRGIISLFAQHEKDVIKMRLRSGRRLKAHKGSYIGGRVALGYRWVDGDLIVNPEEADTIKEVFDLHDKGLSLRKIAAYCNTSGLPTSRGGKWSPSTVRYILLNTLYQGHATYMDSQPVDRPELMIVGGSN